MLDHLYYFSFNFQILPYVILFVEVAFSFIIAILMLFLLYDQIRCIRYNLTYVEYLKQYNIKTNEVGDVDLAEL